MERERREREKLEHDRETERIKAEKMRLDEQKRALKRSLEEESASNNAFKQGSSSNSRSAMIGGRIPWPLAKEGKIDAFYCLPVS